MKEIIVGLDVGRKIVFNINAVQELEDRFDQPVQKIISTESGIGLITFLRAFLYIALKHGGMKFKGTVKENEEFLGELIQEHWIDKGRTLMELMKLCMDAFNESGVFQEGKEGDENPPQNINPNTQ